MWPKWVGRTLGRYQIEELRGRGAMGVVLRASDPDLLRTVAIKIIYPNLAADEDLVERFRLEARTAANLHHRNVVAIHDVGYAEDLYYVVMEYLDGPSLDRIIAEKGALPSEQVLDICEQMAAALDYIHRRKLVHRDVKSTNIIIDPDGRAVLTDFGLVLTSKGSTVTSEGKILGTPQYMAPEQIAGREIGGWTDLYSLGVVAYHMLTGALPFDADAPAALLFQVLWQPPPQVSSLRPGLPAAVDEVFKRALSKEPAERYPSGSAFVGALRQAVRGELPQELPAPPPPRARKVALPSLRAWPSWLWATMGAVVLLLVSGPLLVLGTGLFYTPSAPTATVPEIVLNHTLTPTPLPPPATTPLPSATPTPVPPTGVPSPLPTVTATPPLPTQTPRPTAPPTSEPTGVPTTRAVRPTTRPPTPVPSTPVPSTSVPPTVTPTFSPTPGEPTPRPPTTTPPTTEPTTPPTTEPTTPPTTEPTTPPTPILPTTEPPTPVPPTPEPPPPPR